MSPDERTRSTTNEGRRNHGFSLPEVLVASAIGSVAFGVLATSTVHLSRIMYGMQNYATSEAQSENAMEIVARDIRQADAVASVSSNSFVLQTGTNQVSYLFDSGAETLRRTAPNSDRTLVSHCSEFEVNLYQRCSQSNTYDQFPAATVDEAKLVEVIWRCAATNAVSPANSAYFHSAKIAIRKE